MKSTISDLADVAMNEYLPLALLDFHQSAYCCLRANRTYDSRLSPRYTFTYTCSNQAYHLLLLFLLPYQAHTSSYSLTAHSV
jgi:hypothetical protein